MGTEQHTGTEADDRLSSAIAGLLAFGACMAATAALLAFRTTLGPWIPYSVFVAIVIVFGRGAGLLMGPYIGLVAAIFFDFFFTRPYGSIHIESDSQLVACLLLVVLGLALGVANWIRPRIREARRREAARKGPAATGGLAGSNPPRSH
jgi:K+-sensing histidine kinase KdpD